MTTRSNTMAATMTVRARLDADGTAVPLTRLVAHVPAGACVGPTVQPDALEVRATGERVALAVNPETPWGRVVTTHAAVQAAEAEVNAAAKAHREATARYLDAAHAHDEARRSYWVAS